MPDLLKSASLLTRQDDCVYACDTDDVEDGLYQHRIIVDQRLLDEWGYPDEITVTIEPGDTLNAGGDAVLGVIEDLDT